MTRTYRSGSTATAALRGATFTVGEGKLVALRGRSGSGKTTLLNIVGGLDKPDGRFPDAFRGHVDRVLCERDEATPRPASFVPMTTLWRAQGNQMLGRRAILHRLTPLLAALCS